MTVRQDPLQHYRSKIASESHTVKRKQVTAVRAVQLREEVAEQRFTAENAENAEKSSYKALVKNFVRLAS